MIKFGTVGSNVLHCMRYASKLNVYLRNLLVITHLDIQPVVFYVQLVALVVQLCQLHPLHLSLQSDPEALNSAEILSTSLVCFTMILPRPTVHEPAWNNGDK